MEPNAQVESVWHLSPTATIASSYIQDVEYRSILQRSRYGVGAFGSHFLVASVFSVKKCKIISLRVRIGKEVLEFNLESGREDTVF